MYSIIGADDREYGPVELQTLAQWAREGRVVAHTTILDHSTGRRFLASDMPELAPFFGGSPSVAPPVLKPRQQAPPPVAPQATVPVVYAVAKPRRNRVIAGLLGIFLGAFGAHRYYLGYSSTGTLMLCITLFTCGIGSVLTSVWGLIEGILCLVGAMPDADGQPLTF
jgi:TM2 domain-containing membrane protein YozV